MNPRLIATDIWRLSTLTAALGVSIPAFYDTLMPATSTWALGLYLLSALLIWVSTWRSEDKASARSARRFSRWTRPHQIDRGLGLAMLICAFLPNGPDHSGALSTRLMVELATLVRILSLSQPWWAQTGLLRLTAMAAGVLGLCGVGFYWIDPQINSIGDGLWLAFTTAATVGFGDVVPNTTASRIFSVFVVLLGYGVLSLVTASIAAMFVGTQERKVEQEILRDMHVQLRAIRQEIAELRATLAHQDNAISRTNDRSS